MRVLITGATGFVGSHLAEYTLAERPRVELFGLKRWRSPLEHVRALGDRIRWLDADLRDLGGMIRVLEAARPDIIFHLAAQSYVQSSFVAPLDTLTSNICGTANLLEGVRILGQDPVIHICSSSEVYGQVRPEEVPITEATPLRPASPYAVSKVGEDMIAFQYHLSHGLRTIRTRMFTHTGPRRGSVFAESAFARQIARIEAGLQPPLLRVGNLDSVRTFADVRDTVRAYWLLVERGVPGEVYNIGGQRTMTVGEMLQLLLAGSPQGAAIRVEVDPALLRPSDVTLQIPCVDKFVAATGWRPLIPLERTLGDLLDYWRARCRQEN